jgi:hypothetical protein
MKNVFLAIAFCCILAIQLTAQVNKIIGGAGTTTLEEVTFYQNQNLQGATGKITFVAKILRFPFTNKKNVSFSVNSGKIAYIKFCYEIPYEQAFVGTVNNIDLTSICGIRVDEVQQVSLAWSGISTEIHNNDCKKVFGTVSVKFKEVAPDGTEGFLSLRNSRSATNDLVFNAFNKANADIANRYGNFVSNNNPVPDVNTMVSMPGFGRDECWLPIGKTAIRDGRVKMIITSNVKSAHKSGDLELDYSSNVKMAAPVTDEVPINYLYNGEKLVNRESPRFFVGPYQATGSPNNKTIASGGIYKNFRVHFIIQGL